MSPLRVRTPGTLLLERRRGPASSGVSRGSRHPRIPRHRRVSPNLSAVFSEGKVTPPAPANWVYRWK